ncbi:hypothetical protein DFH08DRAFT_813032 [Mycena albidolilacea]|uniref:Uncharacterized protein n=1 Tax=Mycena albidolilacea TaxID=1033008 RepID=A0AAD7EMI7_9AGAR|nr:hypothetical protein DFH08DRAFT_813032 [Mycena albidolilacea]
MEGLFLRWDSRKGGLAALIGRGVRARTRKRRRRCSAAGRSGYAGTAAGRCGGGVVARWDGTAVTWGEKGTARDSGGDAERKRVHSVVAGREGLGNEEAVVGGGDAEAGGCAQLWELGRRIRAADVEEGACARGEVRRGGLGRAGARTEKQGDVAWARVRSRVMGTVALGGRRRRGRGGAMAGRVRSEGAQTGGAAGEGSRDRHAREGAAAVPGETRIDWKETHFWKSRGDGDNLHGAEHIVLAAYLFDDAISTMMVVVCRRVATGGARIVGIIIRGFDWHAARIVPKLSSCMGSAAREE